MPPADADHVAPAEPAVPARASGAVVNWRDFFVQLVIVTAGVLIALLLQGLVDWTGDRALVREARANIRQELQDNLREVDDEIAGLKRRQANLENALQLINDLLASGKSNINQIDIGSSLAGLSSASWRSAERTGALALMEYRHVQALSMVYDAQDLYVAQQRRSLERVAGAMLPLPGGHMPRHARISRLFGATCWRSLAS